VNVKTEDVIVAKLQDIIDNYEKDKFTEDELTVLHKMIELWMAFEVMGQVAGVARNVFIWVAGFTLLWFTPLEQIVKSIRKLVGLD
jgi:hypothetical protein